MAKSEGDKNRSYEALVADMVEKNRLLEDQVPHTQDAHTHTHTHTHVTAWKACTFSRLNLHKVMVFCSYDSI